MSLFTIAIVGSLIGGGVMALFFDTETSTGNTFTAGTLDLKVNGQDDPNVKTVSFSNLKPGDLKYVTFKLKNVGNLDGWLTIRIKNRVNLENGLEEPEIAAGDIGDPGELGSQLKLRIWHDTNKNGLYEWGEYTWVPISGGFLNNVPEGVNLFASYTMVAGSEHIIIFRFQFPNLGSNNMAMGDSVVFDIVFGLTQK